MGVLSCFSPEAFPAFIGFFKGWGPVLPLVKGLLAFPIAYHFWAGARHLYWDATGKGLEDTETLDKSCYAVIGVSLVSTLILALL
jgi:succinate dehydrogenase/fumarate reductase cytochrome b subunit